MLVNTARVATHLLYGLVALGFGVPTLAQLPPRLTGDAVTTRLDATGHALAARAAKLHDARLDATSQRLEQMVATLRKVLAGNMDKPATALDGSSQAALLRADAAAQRTQAYLDASDGCLGGDAKALIEALAVSVDQLAVEHASKAAPPVIDAVETMDHRPLFAIRPEPKPVAFALVGANLSDPQCADPQITVTDAGGKSLDAQPVVTGVSPARIELKWPTGTALEPGSYVLHVLPKRKVFLLGCSAQPEAAAAVQVVPPLRITVSYTLTAVCHAANGERSMSLGTGAMPDITAHGATVSQPIDTSACADPVSYAITAKAAYEDGSSATAGPIVQSADAAITAGLPGGLSVSWDPGMHTLFVRAGANRCKGVY
ncbi:hypothetical protein [Rhodanobacter koreensis]